MLLLLTAATNAASLDQLEVGGPWGTPNHAGATAVWWNPAGIASETGFRSHVELAVPTARMTFDRADPNGGSTEYTLTGQPDANQLTAGIAAGSMLPYAGLVWAGDVKGHKVGIGAALAVPQVRGGIASEPDAAGRWAMEEGRITGIYGMGALAWSPMEKISVGAVGGIVRSTWVASSDKDTLPDLADGIAAASGSHSYTDDMLEDDDYVVQTNFDLADTAFTGGLSIWGQPHDRVQVSAAYLAGTEVHNRGDVALDFECPPQSDTGGRFVAESKGICDTSIQGDATVSYQLPPRIHGGVAVEILPEERLVAEVMGGWVGWSVYEDFTIDIDGVAEKNAGLSDESVDSIESTKVQARDAENAVWGGLDLKGRPTDWLTLGARALYDTSAVPDHALATNNYDANTLQLAGLASFHVGKMTLGGSYTHSLAQERLNTTSAFGADLARTNEERFFYPHANGTFNSDIKRFAVHAGVEF
ncbi:MAG: hypothetical protein GY913_31925 [Proteobacteria bacterium]|nr:hypothetical protein [Pseudomonadota bacterium]MCP4921529.1 hypothetical protein [Pseudomonadota bacterium]